MARGAGDRPRSRHRQRRGRLLLADRALRRSAEPAVQADDARADRVRARRADAALAPDRNAGCGARRRPSRSPRSLTLGERRALRRRLERARVAHRRIRANGGRRERTRSRYPLAVADPGRHRRLRHLAAGAGADAVRGRGAVRVSRRSARRPARKAHDAHARGQPRVPRHDRRRRRDPARARAVHRAADLQFPRAAADLDRLVPDARSAVARRAFRHFDRRARHAAADRRAAERTGRKPAASRRPCSGASPSPASRSSAGCSTS